MGAGTSGLYFATEGATPCQTSFWTPDDISVRHRGPTYVAELGNGEAMGSDIGGGVGLAIRDRTLLLTPPDVLKECLHWRIGAISAERLVRWIHSKLNDGRYRMEPPQLRTVLKSYLPKLKATKAVGEGYDLQAFFTVIEQLEALLETM